MRTVVILGVCLLPGLAQNPEARGIFPDAVTLQKALGLPSPLRPVANRPRPSDPAAPAFAIAEEKRFAIDGEPMEVMLLACAGRCIFTKDTVAMMERLAEQMNETMKHVEEAMKQMPPSEREIVRKKIAQEKATAFFRMPDGRRGSVGGLPGQDGSGGALSVAFESYDLKNDILISVEYLRRRGEPAAKSDALWEEMPERLKKAAIVVDSEMRNRR